MWQQQQQNPYVLYNAPLITSTPLPNANGSIDYVVNQIEMFAGQINTLQNDGEAAGLQIADRAVQTYHRMSDAFQNETIQNVDRLVEIVNEKTHNWPVTELIVLVIVGVILVIITLIFLFMRFGQSVVEYRFGKKVSNETDIENI
ncbi:unnamed protein product [Caenorhabditis bovis]|uniref:Uncharacterized protein n=1 Tax=Caenorhabditis bovis TaxID=2654633 RepID=A0A8S1E931_9PELO|nr:unnamed protein product [Caenorhabditis bovis]